MSAQPPLPSPPPCLTSHPNLPAPPPATYPQLTINLVALIVAFVAAITNGETPLNVLQLLWVNLIMDSLAALGARRGGAGGWLAGGGRLAAGSLAWRRGRSSFDRSSFGKGWKAALTLPATAAAASPPRSAGHRGPHARPAGQEAARARRAAHLQVHVEVHRHAGRVPGAPRARLRALPLPPPMRRQRSAGGAAGLAGCQPPALDRQQAHLPAAPCAPRPARRRRPPQVFWLFLIFYGMPSQLSAFDVPSQSEFFTNPAAYGYTAMPQQYCCAPGTPDGTPGACFGPGSYLTTGARGAGRAGASGGAAAAALHMGGQRGGCLLLPRDSKLTALHVHPRPLPTRVPPLQPRA